MKRTINTSGTLRTARSAGRAFSRDEDIPFRSACNVLSDFAENGYSSARLVVHTSDDDGGYGDTEVRFVRPIPRSE